MKNMSFVVFFSVFITVYTLVNYYIYIHGKACLPDIKIARTVYFGLFLFMALSYIPARIFERFGANPVVDFLLWNGSFWFSFMLYFFLASVLFDLIRLINHFIPFYPRFITDNYQQAKTIIGIVVVILVSTIVFLGYLNAKNPRIVKYKFEVNKKSTIDSLRIAFVSDVHLGSIIKNSELDHMVDMIESMEPDIVMLGGDIVDEDLAPVIRYNLGETLRTIKSKYGTFATTGNHEFIGGYKEACKYLTDHNIKMVCDTVIEIDNAFYVSGRFDKSIKYFTKNDRIPVKKLIEGLNPDLPLILMDHEPSSIGEISENNIDLALSGHTHHGQMWPLNFVTSKVFKISWGHKKINNTHFYVSCGFGTWGPPVRIGNRPEVVQIDLIMNLP